MGFSMESFVPLYMNSQLAGVIDYNFSTSNGAGHGLCDLLKIPALLQNPRSIIESLYWIEEILEAAEEPTRTPYEQSNSAINRRFCYNESKSYSSIWRVALFL